MYLLRTIEVSLVLTCVVAFASPAPAADESRALPRENNGIASQYVDDVYFDNYVIATKYIGPLVENGGS